MTNKKAQAEDKAVVKTEGNSQGKESEVVKDLPPANPFGEPVKPAEEYPNISEAGKTAAALGVETEETKGHDGPFGETIVEHPLSPTDTNPNPHGTREQPFVSVPVKGADGEVEFTGPKEGNIEIEGTFDHPQGVHLGDGRVLAKGERAKVTKEIASDPGLKGKIKRV